MRIVHTVVLAAVLLFLSAMTVLASEAEKAQRVWAGTFVQPELWPMER